MTEPRELALRLDDGTIIRDKGWRSVGDVMAAFHGFGTNQVYGVVVDAETLVQVYPYEQEVDGTGTWKD